MKGSIVFFSNPENTASKSVMKDTMEISLSNGYHCIALDTNCLQDIELPNALAFIVAIGGDGTILKAVPLAEHYSLPVLGINLGRVGFLSEILPEDFENALHKYEAGRLFIDERMMLACAVNGQHAGNCLNEVLLYKARFSGVAHISFSVDGKDAGSVSCDGMIIGTPTGATGYSISAGGPIISPGLHACVITPVCPHSLLARPIVAPDHAELVFQMHSKGCLYIDGQKTMYLHNNDRIQVTKAEKSIRFLRMEQNNLYSLIREKLT